MPGFGFNAKNTKIARVMLEHCRFAYKAYAQGCVYPLDPFYEGHGAGSDSARERLVMQVHKDLGTEKDASKFDPVHYDLTKTPNPHKGVIYRGGVKAEPFILFQPRPLDKSISFARGFDLAGKPVDAGPVLTGATGSVRCCYFQGMTGMTLTHPKAGWASWFGAVLYDPLARVCTIVFRGSRSGEGGRAAKGAQFHSKGSPDWVTDMNWLKGVAVNKYDSALLGAGFHYAYESSQKSLLAAFKEAVLGSKPQAIYVTGHSLGGGLATCAYLDIVAGDLYADIVVAADPTVTIACFPISAPPILIGRSSHQKVALNADVSQIYHYFNPKDCVHASSLIEFSGYKFLNGMLGVFSHPLTDPFHLGTEISLASTVAFPAAHEVFEVWKGMNAGTLDREFWPLIDIKFEDRTGPFFSEVPPGMETDFKDALRESIHAPNANQRLRLWLDVVKSDERSRAVKADIHTFNDAIHTMESMKKTQSSLATGVMRDKLLPLRKRLLDQCFKDASAHKASSSCYWTMVQFLTAQQIFVGIH